MRTGLAFAFSGLLLATVWLLVADAWLVRARISIRIGKRNGVSKHCPFTCKRYCPDRSCFVACADSCVLKSSDKHLKAFPHEFKTYDQNKDGFVTVQEFAKTLQADEESSSAALKLADDDGDGRLVEKEFNEAPYHKVAPENDGGETKRDGVNPEPDTAAGI